MSAKRSINDLTKGELRTALKKAIDKANYEMEAVQKAASLIVVLCGVLERVNRDLPDDHPEKEEIEFHLGHFRAYKAADN